MAESLNAMSPSMLLHTLHLVLSDIPHNTITTSLGSDPKIHHLTANPHDVGCVSLASEKSPLKHLSLFTDLHPVKHVCLCEFFSGSTGDRTSDSRSYG